MRKRVSILNSKIVFFTAHAISPITLNVFIQEIMMDKPVAKVENNKKT